jgi:LmeA-like phospholipid-binding
VRRLFVLLLVLAVIVGGLALVDHFVKDKAQSAIASHIEAESPGSHAQVTISSFPFLGHLAVSGTVPEIRADVTDVTAGSIEFSSIRLTIYDLKVNRNKLFSGKVKAVSIQRGRVVAVIPQSTVASIAHLPLTLGNGTVSADGVSVPADLSVSGDTISFSASGLGSFSIAVPALDVLPCVSSAKVVTGALRLSCRFTALPSLLSGTSFDL